MVYVVIEIHNNGEFEDVFGVFATLEAAEAARDFANDKYEYPSELRIYEMEVE